MTSEFVGLGFMWCLILTGEYFLPYLLAVNGGNVIVVVVLSLSKVIGNVVGCRCRMSGRVFCNGFLVVQFLDGVLLVFI